MDINDPHHIIAIGSSAGGIEELITFFEFTPLDGVCYVIVQHLSPSFKSRMVELLSRHSQLTVQQAEEGMVVKSNQVYLIPNDKFMTIRGNRLYLSDKSEVRVPHLTVNKFLTSLAADCGPKAVAVILSGLGSDGTDGVKAVKKAGGMAVARNPETTDFSSMPTNAISTGMVDFILEPESMPLVIQEYVQREIDLLASGIKDDQNVAEIVRLINKQLPLDFSDYRQTTILRRIKRRAAFNNFGKLEDYLAFLRENPQEIEVLAKDFLISVTAFFRDSEAYEVLENEILPAIIQGLLPGEELRMWVTGCATGEEAYSLAMLASEQLGDKVQEHEVKIFATDIDSAALELAGRGIYSPALTTSISPERLSRFFTMETDGYKVKPELRRMVIFSHHDLVKNPPFCNMHLVSCRNILIYMNPVLQKKIYLMLLFGLKPDGFLFLGSSENPMPILENLEVVDKKWKIYKNKDLRPSVNFDTFILPQVAQGKLVNTSSPRQEVYKNSERTLADAVNETLVEDLGCLVVCIDEKNKILKTYGDTSRFLLQKILVTDLTELLPEPLAIAYKTVISKVDASQRSMSVNEVRIRQGEQVIMVKLTVSPMVFKGRRNGFTVVTFMEEKPKGSQTNNGHVFDENLYQNQYTRALEQEVTTLKEKLAASTEKLYALEENLQSFNEELLSANEEMQSSNEEMQSINEELQTINSEYQLKNRELLELNDDLNNYFRSNVNGQLFIDADMRLLKFSPGAVKLINLLPSDLGRPISNISTNFRFETITNDIRQILNGSAAITKEIQSNDGKWYQVMTMPYVRQTDDAVHGVVITFNDISELKEIQHLLNRKNESLMRINEDLDNFVHSASHDLLAPLFNIEGSIQALNLINVTNPELNQFLAIIDSSIKKFRLLIGDIATVARIENNALVTEQVDLEEILDNIEWSLEEKIKKSGAVIRKHLEIKSLRFSKKNFRSIVYNLISNGIKFSDGRPPIIDVRTFQQEGYVILSVQDNGTGMTQAEIGKIFDKYSRLQVNVEGQGIGLYLAKKIVDAAGGFIRIESTPGTGSRFMIYFPAAELL
jgi:two-component system CheB/CheR fusion protein